MKKIWIASVSTVMVLMMIVFSASAEKFSEGDQYIELDKPASSEPQILEFFSFYCSHCYQFEQVYHVPQAVRQALPAGTKMARYHVAFLGPLGKELTKAWAVAMALGVGDKVSPLMFEAVQQKHTVQTEKDIRDLFIKAGVSGKVYDSALNSFVVNSLMAQQVQAASDLHVRGVPAMFVNGKYMIRNEGMNMTGPMENQIKQYVDIAKFLINKK